MILLGGVVATPGRVPDTQTATSVGLVADNTSAAVVPNADFVRTRAQAVDMLDATVVELQSSSSASARTVASRLGAISTRLSAATPSDPDELEAIVSALKHERASKLARRLTVTVASAEWRPVLMHRGGRHGDVAPPPPPVEDVVALLGRIIDALTELLGRLFPPSPYVPPYLGRPHR